jgi:flavin reductase (DIM6/NTAB) family NADH-FMN oxidoreductase RutF
MMLARNDAIPSQPMPGESFVPGPDSLKAYKMALGRFSTGVTVITAESDDGPVGFTANSFASVSLDPPLVLWSLGRTSARFEHFAKARHYTIHILAEESADLAMRFARNGFDFSGVAMSRGPKGVQLEEGVLARFSCVQHALHDGGDHLIIVGRVLEALYDDGRPLVTSQGKFGAFAMKAA